MNDKDLFTSIDLSTKEGKWLMAAIAIITTESRTNQTPTLVMEDIDSLAKSMYVPNTTS